MLEEEGTLSLSIGNWADVVRYFPTQALSFSIKDYINRALKQISVWAPTHGRSGVNFFVSSPRILPRELMLASAARLCQAAIGKRDERTKNLAGGGVQKPS